MGKINIISFAILLLTSCVSSHIHNYHFNQKTAASKLREDVVLLKKILEANHPSLYWYTPKDSIDYYFNNAINSINDSLTETAFRNKVAYVISKIHCGHTAVRFSVDYSKFLDKNRYPMFPLNFKTWGDTMVVIGSYLPKDSIFKRGTIITSINRKSNKALLDSMFQLIGTDGYSNVYKSQMISGNFPSMYKLVWGLDSSYNITYLDESGKLKTATITNYSPSIAKVKPIRKVTDSTKTIVKTVPKIKKPSRKQRRENTLLNLRSLSMDSTESTAYMRLSTFSEGHLRTFFRRSFKKLEDTKTKNLIIDLRENTGGYVSTSNLFTKYIINKPFKNADTVAAITKSIKYPYYVRASLKYWFCAHLISRKMADGRYHDRRAETHFFNPKNKHHFNGKVFILQGGYTYSASTLFTSTVKGQNNVTIVGEESGGGNYGNTAMYMPNIILPNSKLRVIMPTFRMVMDANRKKDGRGVMPDVYVPPSSEAIRKGIDIKLTKTKELIAEKK
jgi:hypothetical protein